MGGGLWENTVERILVSVLNVLILILRKKTICETFVY